MRGLSTARLRRTDDSLNCTATPPVPQQEQRGKRTIKDAGRLTFSEHTAWRKPPIPRHAMTRFRINPELRQRLHPSQDLFRDGVKLYFLTPAPFSAVCCAGLIPCARRRVPDTSTRRTEHGTCGTFPTVFRRTQSIVHAHQRTHEPNSIEISSKTRHESIPPFLPL